LKKTDAAAEYDRCRALVDEALAGYFTEDCPQKGILEAMRYSLLAGGKRIRPILTLKFCEAACGSMEPALAYACAVEMLHTYSLIHDDLPCMDDDDLRRGKPTNHKVFGEWSAVLAGDALQAAAFEAVLAAKNPPESRAAAAAALAGAAGPRGICGGQYLDMAGEGGRLTEREVTTVHTMKTAALLRAACVMGLLAAPGAATDAGLRAAGAYADALGLAFQIRDDMLDVLSSAEAMGKSVGSDAGRGKTTFATLLGAEGCRKRVAEKTAEARRAVQGVFPDTAFLTWMADYLMGREK